MPLLTMLGFIALAIAILSYFNLFRIPRWLVTFSWILAIGTLIFPWVYDSYFNKPKKRGGSVPILDYIN